jgi:putative ABC transport system permease protein
MTEPRPLDPPGASLLRAFARLVPLPYRDEWLAEWMAEARHAWRDAARERPVITTHAAIRLRVRCLGAAVDAFWVWRRHGRSTARGSSMLTNDLRFAVRSLLRRPAFTAIVVSTLALCIGATTAVFSIVESVLLNGLEYRRLDRLVAVWSDNPTEKTDRYQVSIGDYYDWRARSRSFSQLAGFFPIWNALYAATDGTERIDVGAVTANLLPTLGVAPKIGRGFLEGEDRPGAPGTVILTHAFWARAFQNDPAIVGKTLMLDAAPYTVIGVMDERFTFPQSRVDVLMPLFVLGEYLNRRGVHMLSVIGRLREGVSLEDARREMAPIGAQLRDEHPKEDAGLGVTVKLLADDLLGDVRRPILVLFGAVCAVLLIGCANVTNLMLGRAWSRRQELAVRMAMGARPSAIVQQLLVESGVIALAATVAGTGIAFLGTRAVAGLVPASISRIGHIGIDGPVLAFTLAVSVLVTILCGTAPALQAVRTTMRRAIGDAARLSHGRGTRRVYQMLVVGELALALVLAVSAGLLINSFARLSHTDPGFRREQVVRMKIVLPDTRYPSGAPRERFYRSLLEQTRALPGVRAAGITNRFPLHDSNITTAVFVEGEPIPEPGNVPSADYRVAGAGYFSAMGIGVRAGRDFGPADKGPSATPYVIVNATAATMFFHSPDPIGRRVTLGSSAPLATVIGVVNDVHDASLRDAPRPQIFMSAEQAAPGTASIVVRCDGASGPVVLAVRRIVRSLDARVPMFDVQTVGDVLDTASRGDRFTMLLLSGFSLLALLLAALGTYGVMAYGVSERTREIGVRIALGARTSDVLRMILREGLALFVIALPIALAGVWATTRALQGLLFGVEATDPWTVAMAVVVLGAVAGVACYVPARRAAAVDPTAAIREADGA